MRSWRYATNDGKCGTIRAKARYNTQGRVPFGAARASRTPSTLYSSRPNTMLIVGTNKSRILEHLPHDFLLIDDGPIIDALTLPARRKATYFDHTKHHFNPLKDISYKTARDFISIINAVFPEGDNTLTRKNSNYILLKALLDRPKTLADVLEDSDDPAVKDAFQKIQTILLSPVLNDVLLRPANFPLKGIVLARLNRAELGDFDCFVLANLLIGHYQGHIIIPDYGFYNAPFHTKLVREDRLTAGVNFLDELSVKLLNMFLVKPMLAAHCTFDDAETLALHAGLERGKVGFSDFVADAMKG